MLQIASGKLYASGPSRSNDLRSVAYTNLQLINRDPIETAAGRIVPTSTLSRSNPFVLEFTEKLEGLEAAGAVVSHGIEPYLEDFSDVLSFASNVTCTPDQELAQRLTSDRPGSLAKVHPQKLIRRVFDASVWCHDDDEDYLVSFVEDLIGLERKYFLAAMQSIRTYVTGIRRLVDDPELTYTLLVASIESLSHRFDGHIPVWEDYDEGKRRKIDRALEHTDSGTKERVRQAILDIEHVAVKKRFVAFALAYLQPSYFREEASGLTHAAGAVDLEEALKHAYDLRSGHIHDLRELPDILKMDLQFRELIRVERTATLTFQGLARLARHVITEFVVQGPKLAAESYDYSGELAGVVRVPLAPEHWVSRVEDLDVKSGRDRLEGFLIQVAAALEDGSEPTVTDLQNMLDQAGKLLPRANADQRRPFLALSILFDELTASDTAMPESQAVRSRYEAESNAPSLEAMLVHLLLGTVPEWPLAVHDAVHDRYLEEQGKRSSLRVPQSLRARLSLALAERHRAAGQVDRARALLTAAVENQPGHEELRNLEGTFDPSEEIPWRLEVPQLHLRAAPNPQRMSGGRVAMLSDICPDR